MSPGQCLVGRNSKLATCVMVRPWRAAVWLATRLDSWRK